MMNWTSEKEFMALSLKSEGKTYKFIANKLNTTPSSVKHKVTRLQQANNEDRYKHSGEKREQARRYFHGGENVLETHCAYGGMTEFYQKYAKEVLSYDVDKARVMAVNNMGFENVTAECCNSEDEILRLVYYKCFFDVIDVDPYGFPSKYFPHVLTLIKDGYLFLTFPKIGVAQINKIMIKHYKSFWGIELTDADVYIKKICEKILDYGFQSKREVTLEDILDIGKVYRFVFKVKKQSLLKLVDLKVNRDVVVRNDHPDLFLDADFIMKLPDVKGDE